MPDWYDAAAEPVLADLMAMPGFRDFWALRRGMFTDDFRRLVDGMRSAQEPRVFYEQPNESEASKED